MTGWLVIDERPIGQGVHVLPDNDLHVARLDCDCHPRAVRDGPLGEPVISHREPSYPGALDKADA